MTLIKKYLFQPSILIILVILCLAFYLRIYKISEYLTFLGDEGRDVLIVKRMLVDHKFTLLGPTASVGGFFLGPIYYYFMIPFLWLWRFDPTGPAVMVGIFGVATVYLVYLTGKNMFSDRIGIGASLIYACSPLVIAYSRSSWNPNIVPFFSLLLIYILWLFTWKQKWKYTIFIGIILGIGIQLHYLFSFLFAVTMFWMFYISYRNKISIFKYLGLIPGFIIGDSLFLLFEIRHGFPNTNSIIQFILKGKDTGFVLTSYFNTIINVLYRLFGRLIFRLPEENAFSTFNPIYIQALILIIYLCLIFACIVAIYKIIVSKSVLFSQKSIEYDSNTKASYGVFLLFSWMIIVILLFGFYRKNIYDYYFGIIFPVPFLLSAFLFDVFSSKTIGKWLYTIIIVGLFVFNWEGRPFKYPPNNQLAQAKKIAQVALQKTNGKPFNFALIAGQNTDHTYRYFFEIWGNSPITIENMSNDPSRKSVTDQLIVICEDLSCKPLGHPLWEIAGFGRAEIAGVWDVPFVKIFKMTHYSESL